MSETTINLEKGHKVDLTKDNAGLTSIGLGLGWDVKSGAGSDYDLDAFALMLSGGKINGNAKRVVYFRNLNPGEGVAHSGDNLTGEGDGDDEVISVNFSQVPADVEEILLCVNIFQAEGRGQNFGQVQNAFIRVFDGGTTTEMMKYDLSEDYSAYTGVKMGKVYRHNGEWKFQAIGEGFSGTIQDFVDSL